MKFRVWDKENKEYINTAINECRIYANGELEVLFDPQCDDGISGFCWEKVKDKYIVEHSTGLTDKNGREIFKGDICDLGNNHRITIIFKDAGFGWLDFPDSKYARIISFSGHDYLKEVMSKIEVISNIHEVQNEA